jgi:hypothetical protein
VRDRESESLRIAFLPDTNSEVAGFAGVSRRFETFAEKRRLPLLVVHAGPRNKTVTASSVTRIQLPRGPIIFALDRMHQYGLAFLRRDPEVAPVVQDFDCCDNWCFPVALQSGSDGRLN